jgi:hypothetical protein
VAQDVNKKQGIFPGLAFYFMKVPLHLFSKIKSHKEVPVPKNQGFSYYFCLMIEGSGD